MDDKKRTRDALIVEYRGFVDTVVKKLIHSMGLPNDQFDEFVAAGYLGLVEAATRFNKEEGVSFKTYAYLRVRGAVIDGIRECSDVSGAGYRYAQALQGAHELRENDLQRCGGRSRVKVKVKVKDKSRARGERLAEVLEYAAKSALAFRLSVSDVEHEMVDNAGPNDPESGIVARQQTQMFVEIVADLPAKERMVIEEFYFRGKSFTEIVNEHEGFSKSWVSRLHSRGLLLLKEKYEKAVAK